MTTCERLYKKLLTTISIHSHFSKLRYWATIKLAIIEMEEDLMETVLYGKEISEYKMIDKKTLSSLKKFNSKLNKYLNNKNLKINQL